MRLAICTPIHGDPKAAFTESLAGLLIHSAKVRPDLELNCFFLKSSMLAESRNRLFGQAREWGARYLLWVDADQSFPADALVTLLDRKREVVGCNYPRRSIPTGPSAASLDGEPLYTTAEKAQAGAVEEALTLGLGFCLMDMAIVPKLERLAVERGKKTLWPLFFMEMRPDEAGFDSEDTYFFRKLRAAGVPAYVDHGLSWRVGHVHEIILTHEDAVAGRADWEQAMKGGVDAGSVLPSAGPQ